MLVNDVVSPELVDFVAPSIKDWSNTWILLPIVPGMSPLAIDQLHRINALGNLFYFLKIILRKHRLTEHLHRDICTTFEKENLKEVLEIPRDHFKSTIALGFAMWRALPFTPSDEQYMRLLSYSDEWIAWMKYVHNQNTRNLFVSANIKNAAKLGRRIDQEYMNNGIFRGLFPEILPNKSDPWAVESMTQRRTLDPSAYNGEGTYDFLGVGAALQSRHYDLIIQDDLVGLDALDSEVVMQGIIHYHQLVVGAFDSVPGRPDLIGDEIVIGNRWQYEDLNSYLREMEPEFNFQSHDAEGGCCAKHPPGKPIFPEEFNWQKLKKIESRLGTYFYSCQYRNKPTPPGDEKFKLAWLRWFNFSRFATKRDDSKLVRSAVFGKNGQIDHYVVTESSGQAYGIKLVHDVVNGEVLKDVYPAHLDRGMIVDPRHDGLNGRSRHCIIVYGALSNPPRIYLLDLWATTDSYKDLIDKMYELGEKWKLDVAYVEGVAFQSFLSYHFEVMKHLRKKEGKWTFKRVDTETLHTDRSADGKTKRIESMEPIYKRGEFFVCKTNSDPFVEEYKKYPYSKFKDIIDTLGYILQVCKPGRVQRDEVLAWLKKNQNYRQGQVNSVTGY